MRVLRGRAAEPPADRALTRTLVEETQETGEPGLRAWYPPRQAVFGPRDRSEPGYERARSCAAAMGFVPVERRVGGRAVVHTGSTLSVVWAVPVDRASLAISDRYEEALDRLSTGLQSLGVETTRGEPPDSFCPGTHSLSVDGKLAGLAQRAGRDVAVVGSLVVVADEEGFADPLASIYRALALSFDRASVGSVAAAAGTVRSQEEVRDAIEAAFSAEARTSVQTVPGYDPSDR